MPTGTLTLRTGLGRKLTVGEMDDNLTFLSASYSYREDLLNSTTTYVVSHSLNEDYPIVQVWETGSKEVVIPSSIVSNNTNTLTLTFADNFNGRVIVKV